MKYLIIFVLMITTICIVSCCRSMECPPIKFSSREYTGLDTLIRIDGYYYREENTRLVAPFIISNNGEFKVFFNRFETHEEIQNPADYLRVWYGGYILTNDTIKIEWLLKYRFEYCRIYSEQYVILNDTTLKRIWFSSYANTDTDRQYDFSRNEIYKFYKFP